LFAVAGQGGDVAADVEESGGRFSQHCPTGIPR
jgi:hypothetical protein